MAANARRSMCLSRVIALFAVIVMYLVMYSSLSPWYTQQEFAFRVAEKPLRGHMRGEATAEAAAADATVALHAVVRDTCRNLQKDEAARHLSVLERLETQSLKEPYGSASVVDEDAKSLLAIARACGGLRLDGDIGSETRRLQSNRIGRMLTSSFQPIDDFLTWLMGARAHVITRTLLGTVLPLCICVFLYEALCMRSTLFSGKLQTELQEVHDNWKDFILGNPFNQSAQDSANEEIVANKGEVEQWNEQHIGAFWSKVQAGLATPSRPLAAPVGNTATVGFVCHTFAVFETDDRVTITIQRCGSCASPLECRARSTTSDDASGYAACAGKDFEEVEVSLLFSPGERLKSFTVPIHATSGDWKSTRWFLIELEVTAGEASYGGPMITQYHDDGSMIQRPSARVYILQEDKFPLNAPDSLTDRPLLLAAYYIRDRVRARGVKFWKTMVGMLYPAVHSVVVTSLIQKYMIDWACDWDSAGTSTYGRILILVGIQVISFFLLRWADWLQRNNRGRTGGTRMEHRWRLLSKMLMLEHHDHCEINGSRWFYAALANVETITVDGYWQAFVVAQSLFALFLSLSVLIWSNWHKGGKTGGATMLIILPISSIWIVFRHKRIARMLHRRMDAEEKWVDTYSWVTRALSSLYSLGPREFATLEQRFKHESGEFCQVHSSARDLMSDSTWITRWLSAIAYIFFLTFGAVRLVHAREDSSTVFEVGSYVLQLKLVKEFDKYLTKMNDSFVKLQKASVSIRRVRKLLGAPEHRSLHARALHDDEVEEVEQDLTRTGIELQQIEYVPTESDYSTEFMGPLQMRPNVPCIIPLGRVVRVSGAAAATELSFFGLVARVLKPTSGFVRYPGGQWAILLPPVAASPPGITVIEALKLMSAPQRLVERFARVLFLNPHETTNRLSPGQLQVLAIARAMLRNPSILLLDRPLVFVRPECRHRVQLLLRLWQEGGTARIVDWLCDSTAASTKGSDAGNAARTLIITTQDMESPAGMPPLPREAEDVHIDLGDILELCCERRQQASGRRNLSATTSSEDESAE